VSSTDEKKARFAHTQSAFVDACAVAMYSPLGETVIEVGGSATRYLREKGRACNVKRAEHAT